MSLDMRRKEIEKIDSELLFWLKKRFVAAKKIAIIKKKLKLSITDKSREAELLEKNKRLGKKLGLDPKFVETIVRLIICESKKIQAGKND